eukprot:Skav216827  [mRNA]  locus=scaffold2314:7853:9099:- [translate_table: standard]
MFLLTLLGSCAWMMFGLGVPGVSGRGAAKTKAKAKAKAKTQAKAKAAATKTAAKRKLSPDEKAGLQANLAGQVYNAKKKLAQANAGTLQLTEEEKSALELKVNFWNQYQMLPRNSEGKNEMLELWSLDKTCNRWAHRTEETTAQQVEEARFTNEYLTRFEVAREENLNMRDPTELQILEDLLAGLPQDDKWDAAEPRQAAFAKAGLVRYHYQRSRGEELKDINSASSTVQAGGSFKQKAGTPFIADGPASNPVKEENPDFHTFAMSLASLRQARYKLIKKISELEDVQLALQSAEGVDAKNMAEMDEKVDLAQTALKALKTTSHEMDQIRRDTFDVDVHTPQVTSALADTEAHYEGVLLFLKKARKWKK